MCFRIACVPFCLQDGFPARNKRILEQGPLGQITQRMDKASRVMLDVTDMKPAQTLEHLGF